MTEEPPKKKRKHIINGKSDSNEDTLSKKEQKRSQIAADATLLPQVLHYVKFY